MSLENIFTLPSEYNDLRDSLRSLSENEIAPFAREVDEDHRYPQEAHDALVKSGLFAAHVPSEFGGDGADALATCIIIEEDVESKMMGMNGVSHTKSWYCLGVGMVRSENSSNVKSQGYTVLTKISGN